MKGHKALMVFLLSLVLLTGCWDSTEIEDQFLVWVMGWDVPKDSPNKILLSMTSPTTSEDAPKPYAVFSATGYSVEEARNSIQRYFFREIELGHMRVLMIGEDFACKGILKHLDALGRNPKIGRETLIVVVDGRAEEIYQLKNPAEALPGEYMVDLIQQNAQLDNAVDSTFREFFECISQEGREPATAYVKMTKNKSAFNSSGIAVFKGDKMVGSLTDSDIRSYLLIRNLSKSGRVTIGKATEPGGQSTTFVYHRHTTRIKTKVIDGLPHAYVNITLEGDVAEYTPQKTIVDEKAIAIVEKALEKALKGSLEKTVKTCQNEFNSDIFGFGMYFRAFHPTYWNSIKWDEQFPEMKLHFTVDVQIRRVGIEG